MDLFSSHLDVLLQVDFFEITLAGVWGRFLPILGCAQSPEQN
ncbi:unnamed protein product [Linum tenue]|uniref:Uncharacterized protein n=1 Tax=Linum tenue TaxID=586396 RepID=A0AAV0MWW9_9ROSI|nr:unnamed protein product [Linum tenue]